VSEGNQFGQWMGCAFHAPDFKPSIMREANTFRPLSQAEKDAYDAPFPTRITMAAPRTFPSLLNQTIGKTEPAREQLKQSTKPFITMMGTNELGLDPAIQQWYIDNVPGAKGQAHHRYADGSHYIQDDKGADLAARVDAFIKANP
jgi:haloalkane dehalogenase